MIRVGCKDRGPKDREIAESSDRGQNEQEKERVDRTSHFLKPLNR